MNSNGPGRQQVVRTHQTPAYTTTKNGTETYPIYDDQPSARSRDPSSLRHYRNRSKIIVFMCEKPVFVSGTWILDSNRSWDSGFLEVYSRFQSPGFQISQAKISWIQESRFSFTGQKTQNHIQRKGGKTK